MPVGAHNGPTVVSRQVVMCFEWLQLPSLQHVVLILQSWGAGFVMDLHWNGRVARIQDETLQSSGVEFCITK